MINLPVVYPLQAILAAHQPEAPPLAEVQYPILLVLPVAPQTLLPPLVLGHLALLLSLPVLYLSHQGRHLQALPTLQALLAFNLGLAGHQSPGALIAALVRA